MEETRKRKQNKDVVDNLQKEEEEETSNMDNITRPAKKLARRDIRKLTKIVSKEDKKRKAKQSKGKEEEEDSGESPYIPKKVAKRDVGKPPKGRTRAKKYKAKKAQNGFDNNEEYWKERLSKALAKKNQVTIILDELVEDNVNKSNELQTIVVTADDLREELDELKELEPRLENVNTDRILTVWSEGTNDKMTRKELYTYLSECAVYGSMYHYDYDTIGSRIYTRYMYGKRGMTMLDVAEIMYKERRVLGRNRAGEIVTEKVDVVSENYAFMGKQVYEFVVKNSEWIESLLHYERDYNINYMAVKTLCKTMLYNSGPTTVERFQHMLMRNTIGINVANLSDLDTIKETYELLSSGYYTQATPTMMLSGTFNPQMSSCFLITMKEDSIDGIYETLKRCALLSKGAGGIGLDITCIRAAKSYIRGTNGESSGIMPMLRVFNDTARYVDQGGGKRKGSFAIYLEPWHADVEQFIEIKSNTGKEELKSRDLYPALWCSELLAKRVKEDGNWSLFCPTQVPGLRDTWGDEFEKLYVKYESTPFLPRKTMKARDLWTKIVKSCIETSLFIVNKDSCNRHSNHNHLGTIHSSNLCVSGDTEILTKQGYVGIQTVVEKEVELWNGFEYSTVKVKKTGEDQKLVRVKFSNGSHLDCTLYHKFYISKADSEGKKLEDMLSDTTYTDIVEAKDIKLGMKLAKFRLPVIQTPGELETWSVEVTSIENLCGLHDTYCFNEPLRHTGVFNRIMSSQCTEVVQFTSPDEISVCNLSSVALPRYVVNGEIDHKVIFDVVRVIVRNGNKIIDQNYYSLQEARNSNMRHRPIGIGIQGLAKLYTIMRCAYGDDVSRKINREVMETIYFAALTESCNLAKRDGPYSTYQGSMMSKGILQFDTWGVTPSDRWDWTSLRADIAKYGVRNSLLTALMPTATSAQIFDNSECFEPYMSHMMTRKILSGEFTVVTRQLVDDLMKLGLWNDHIRSKIAASGGSVSGIEEIPEEIRRIYPVAWEIKMKTMADMAHDREPYLCQSQSRSAYFKEANYQDLSNYLLYCMLELRDRTPLYYYRTRPSTDADNIMVDASKKLNIRKSSSGLKESSDDITTTSSSSGGDISTPPPKRQRTKTPAESKRQRKGKRKEIEPEILVKYEAEEHASKRITSYDTRGDQSDINTPQTTTTSNEDSMVCRKEEGCIVCGC